MFQFKAPTTILINGCTGSGKTYFCYELLKHRNELFTVPPERTIVFFSCWQKIYDLMSKLPNVEFYKGLPSSGEEYSTGKHCLLVLDDLLLDVVKSESIANIFLKESHHLNLSIILIVQNLYQKGPWSRLITLNSHYLILFKSPRDLSLITTIGRQLYPGRGKILVESYTDAISNHEYGYLLCDLSPKTSEEDRLRTEILPGESCFVYRPKKELFE